MNDIDHHFMAQALALAEFAGRAGEVPVGAVLVSQGQIIGRGYNNPIGRCDPSAHAEVLALRDAGQQLGNYRLPGTTLYVTIEPCAMCFGACIHGRVQRLVYGAAEPKAGVVSTQSHWLQGPWFNHKIAIEGGQSADRASRIMQEFFARRRLEQQAEKKAKAELIATPAIDFSEEKYQP